MEGHSFSILGARDGFAGRQGDSVCDDYDELSNATIGTSSPLARVEPRSPCSDSKSHHSAYLSPISDNDNVRAPTEPPKQLPLSNHNLHGFTAGMEAGDMPLRTDVVPNDEYVEYTANAVEKDTDKNKRALQADISVVTAAGGTLDHGDFGSDAADWNTYGSTASLHIAEASQEGNPWNVERASVDVQVGSPNCQNAEPLSTANLDQHLHNLTRGPAPLFVENVVTSIPTAARERNASTAAIAPEETVASNAVDPSEVDTHSRSEAISPLCNGSPKRSSVGEGMDDMWSTASTRGRDGNPFSIHNSDGNPHALSKKNLRQLRHQLESGETPLRPEVLAGLGSMVRVMTQKNSNMSASTAVEVPANEDRSKLLGASTITGSPMQSPVMRPSHRDVVKESDVNGIAAMSFHSTLVEVPVTEPGDRREGGNDEYQNRQFAVSEPADASNPDVDEEDVGNVDEVDEEDPIHGKSSMDDSREGQNESVFNMTEDDGVDDMGDNSLMARHMRELFKLVQESQRDQTHLRQQVMEQRNVIERLQNMVQMLEAELSALKKQ
ncbi:hypothetical protein ABL78_0369 [Leptomonas seymouri]|uniref:Uncharacterized protein n=1 Tax=Leptomonas seymouri TaxID=5684 RepID=A0A0N0P8X2_LEPSE|nr:hypothetical protein ABL78_0369 [Leptomonas seymouri]|eukprot:KPI90439.1 hypothetical protein ABL78_0369 [Leptomonas seymouri]